MVVQPNKAIVGANAFAHESGIHQDGMLKHQATYEIMRPETVGVDADAASCSASTRAARRSRARLAELGYGFDDAALDRIFARFKALADRRKAVADADLEALVHDDAKPQDELFALEGLQVALRHAGHADGDGAPARPRRRGARARRGRHRARSTPPTRPSTRCVDAPAELLEFSVRSVTEGIDALGEVTVRVRGARRARHEERAARGRERAGRSTATAPTPTSSSPARRRT